MTENAMTLVDVSPPGSGEPPEELPPLTAAEQDTVRELVRQARASGAAQPARQSATLSTPYVTPAHWPRPDLF